MESLRGKIGEGDFESMRAVLNRNADVFSKHKANIGCCNFVEHKIELEKGTITHREGGKRMTPHKSEACRAGTETSQSGGNQGRVLVSGQRNL